MDEYKYFLECTSCETKLELVVHDVDELPIFCPMCGDDQNSNWNN